jgi:acyl-coenzyme A synthetase/AMP-(fatty) acid ligase
VIKHNRALGIGPKTAQAAYNTGGANAYFVLDGSNGDLTIPADITFRTSDVTQGAIVNVAGNNTIQGPLNLIGGDGDTVLNSMAGSLTVTGDAFAMETVRRLRFWGDADGSRLHDAYFERFPGVWAHGDFIVRTPAGGYEILGRSDATLNANGVRIGTAEIYRIVESFDEVTEALAVGQAWDGDTRVVLFVTMTAGAELDDELRARIRSALRMQASPRHVPAVIAAAPALPRTRSNKLAELAVGDTVNGRVVRDASALANPDALQWFAEWTSAG